MKLSFSLERIETMISYIKGRLLERYEDSIILENNGIGYQIQVPVSFCRMCGRERSFRFIHIFMSARTL